MGYRPPAVALWAPGSTLHSRDCLSAVACASSELVRNAEPQAPAPTGSSETWVGLRELCLKAPPWGPECGLTACGNRSFVPYVFYSFVPYAFPVLVCARGPSGQIIILLHVPALKTEAELRSW